MTQLTTNLTNLDPDHDGRPASAPEHHVARCRDGTGSLSHLFFSSDDVEIARAKSICSRCTLASSCLDGALRRREPYGVWGGQLLVDGVPVRFAPRRGRPSKTPRVEFVLDEVPIPAHLVA